MEFELNSGRPSILTTDRVMTQITQILNEAITNTVRHASANLITVDLKEDGGILRMSVEDNGCGFDAREAAEGGLGIRAMHERANKAGGRLKIASVPGEGTSVSADIPLYI